MSNSIQHTVFISLISVIWGYIVPKVFLVEVYILPIQSGVSLFVYSCIVGLRAGLAFIIFG